MVPRDRSIIESRLGMPTIEWGKLAVLVWKQKWEGILGIAGVVASVVAGVPPWLGIPLLLLAFLLLVDLAMTTRLAVRLVREKQVPIVVIVGKDDDEFYKMMGEVWATTASAGCSEDVVSGQWKLDREDYVIRRDSILPRQSRPWKDLVRQFASKIARLGRRLPGRHVFHIFLNCPSALAIGLGARMGSLAEVVCYHYQPGVRYVPVIDFSRARGGNPQPVRAVKRRITQPYQFICVEQVGTLTQEVFVSLRLSGHDPKGAVNLIAPQHAARIRIRNTYDNVLSTDAHWLRVEQEVVTVLTELLGGGIRRLHLFLSVPVVLAFAIGMALGIHSPITVYHWFGDKQEYRPVLELERLGELR